MLPEHEEPGHYRQRYHEQRPFPTQIHAFALPVQPSEKARTPAWLAAAMTAREIPDHHAMYGNGATAPET